MAKILKSDGTEEELKPPEGSEFLSLEQLQKAVGGYIEEVKVAHSDNFLIVNEEGLLKHLPKNERASEMIKGYIVGDVVLCSTFELET